MQTARPRERGSIFYSIAASVFVLVVYVSLLVWLPRDVFWHPDEGSKYVGVRTISWDHGIRYDLPYAGKDIDPRYQFYPPGKIYPSPPKRDGTVEFHWSILFPLLTRPFLDAFGNQGIYILPLLCGWLVALLAGVWTYPYAPRGAALVILLTGLGTPVAFYSLSFFEHTPTTLCASLALTALFFWPGRTVALLVMAPLLAASVALRFETSAFVGAALAAWVVCAVVRQWWEPRGLLRAPRSKWFLAVAALALLFVVGYFAWQLLPGRHTSMLEHMPGGLERIWHKRDYFVDSLVRVFIGQLPMTNYQMLFGWQIVSMIALGGIVIAPFADNRRTEAWLILPSLFILLQSSLLTLMNMLPFLQRQGVLAVAPFMAIALFGLPEAFRRRDERLLALSVTGALATLFGFLAVFVTRVAEHDGGSLLGLDGAPRYLLWLYPIGASLCVISLAAYRDSDAPPLARSLLRAMVVALMLVSFYYEYLGIKELDAKRTVLVDWRTAISEQEPVVTDMWWLPAVLAPYWVDHPIFVVRQERMGRFLDVARRHGIQQFTFASQYRIDPYRFSDTGELLMLDSTEFQELNVARFRLLDAPSGGTP